MSSAVRFRSRPSPSHSGASRPRDPYSFSSVIMLSLPSGLFRRHEPPSVAMRRLPPAGGAMRRAVPCAWLRQWEDRSRQPAAHLVGVHLGFEGRPGHVHVLQGGAQQFETTAREYQRLSAGTRYQGAAAVLVFSNTSCHAAIYSSQRSRASGDRRYRISRTCGIIQFPRKCFFCSSWLTTRKILEDGASAAPVHV